MKHKQRRQRLVLLIVSLCMLFIGHPIHSVGVGKVETEVDIEFVEEDTEESTSDSSEMPTEESTLDSSNAPTEKDKPNNNKGSGYGKGKLPQTGDTRNTMWLLTGLGIVFVIGLLLYLRNRRGGQSHEDES